MAPRTTLAATKFLNSINTRLQSINADLSAAKATQASATITSGKTSVAATSSHYATVTSYSDRVVPTTIAATITSTNARGQAQVYTTNNVLTTTQRVPYTSVIGKASPCTTTGCKWPKFASFKCCEQRKKGWVAVLIVVVIALIILAIFTFLFLRSRNKKRNGASQEAEEEVKEEESQRMINDTDEPEPYVAYADTQKGATSHVKEDQSRRSDHEFQNESKERY